MSGWIEKVAYFIGGYTLLERKEPVFHGRPPGLAQVQEDGRFVIRAHCGRILSAWGGGQIEDRSTLMLREYAEYFARPCSQCFPEEYRDDAPA